MKPPEKQFQDLFIQYCSLLGLEVRTDLPLDKRLKPEDLSEYDKRDLANVSRIVVHQGLATPSKDRWDLSVYQWYHVAINKFKDIAYHAGTEDTGEVYHLQDFDRKTWHVGKYNRKSLGWIMVGNFTDSADRLDPTIASPARAGNKSLHVPTHQWDNTVIGIAAMHTAYKHVYGKSLKIMGHSDLPGYEWKECPMISMKVLIGDVYSKAKELEDLLTQSADPVVEFVEKEIQRSLFPTEVDQLQNLIDSFKNMTK